MSGIYIHIPYCRRACHYCDFHFSTNLSTKDALVSALLKEIELQNSYLSSTDIDTVYFGGGTPSLLTKHELNQILDRLGENFNFRLPEITLEANPEDLNLSTLYDLKEIGVNRLSIGIQSFNDQFLKLFNRSHSSEQSIKAYNDARKVGFDNISVDLIYGLPDQNLVEFTKDLKQILALGSEHISIYGLTIEENTVFGNWHRNGKLKPIDEDIAASQFGLLMDTLNDSGYIQYEVSNFCKPGYESKHNSSYWTQDEYLGIGPGAHSYNKTSRQYNVSNNIKYIKKLEMGILDMHREVLSEAQKFNEFVLTRLRIKSGIDLEVILHDYHIDLIKRKEKEIDLLKKHELIDIVNNHLVLTKKGILVADSITERLAIDY